MEKPWANHALLQALAKVAGECFKHSMPSAKTRAEWEAAIDVWNKLLDDAIANANTMKDEYVRSADYFHAIIARDMSDYFETMKATKDAPFRPVSHDARETIATEMIKSNLKRPLDNPPDAKCSFCGLDRSETGVMVEGPAKNLFICRDCSALISTLSEIIDATVGR